MFGMQELSSIKYIKMEFIMDYLLWYWEITMEFLSWSWLCGCLSTYSTSFDEAGFSVYKFRSTKDTRHDSHWTFEVLSCVVLSPPILLFPHFFSSEYAFLLVQRVLRFCMFDLPHCRWHNWLAFYCIIDCWSNSLVVHLPMMSCYGSDHHPWVLNNQQ